MDERTQEILRRAEAVNEARRRLEEAQRAFEALITTRTEPPGPGIPPPPEHLFIRALQELGGEGATRAVSEIVYAGDHNADVRRLYAKRTHSRLNEMARAGTVVHDRERQVWRLVRSGSG